MEKIIINTANHTSVIAIGEKWSNLEEYLPSGNCVIITDENLFRHYGQQFPDLPVITIKSGEGSKRLATVENIAGQLLELGIDRSGFIIGFGGGVVCDIAGFVASVYMRGIGFGFVSTSLLSQIDASVGGKNGVNSALVKNVLGTFNQPGFVICDPAMLKTLPEDEFLSGLAEMIKAGAILDGSLLEDISAQRSSILNRDEKILAPLIERSVKLKASVVAEDEREAGNRMILNFGHTFGHVIESSTSMKHGYAIASGMAISAGISVSEGILEKKEAGRLKKILGDFGLLTKFNIPEDVLLKKISGDKKKKGNDISFVLIGPVGKATIAKIPVKKLIEYYKSHSGSL